MKKMFVLPSYVKWIALALIVVDLTVAFLCKNYFDKNYIYESKEIMLNVLNLALFLWFMAKRREEDEMITQQRIFILASSIIFSIVIIFVNNILHITDESTSQFNSPSGMMLQLLLFVNIMFEFILRRQRKELDAE